MSNRMPALFAGHGSPTNAIDHNQYSNTWEEIGRKLKKPEAILAVSAHWFTDGTRITDAPKPRVVYDMYGFPDELYCVVYQPDGAPALAQETKALITQKTAIDNSWGIDHGTWSVLCRMFPKADIPVFQLSVNARADAQAHYQIGKEIAALREKGVMVFGSGNVVHNLSRIDWSMDGGYRWAEEFDGYIKDRVVAGDTDGVLNYSKAGSSAALAFTSPDHFNPLLYVLGAVSPQDHLTIFNDSCTLGGLSMTSYLYE